MNKIYLNYYKIFYEEIFKYFFEFNKIIRFYIYFSFCIIFFLSESSVIASIPITIGFLILIIMILIVLTHFILSALLMRKGRFIELFSDYFIIGDNKHTYKIRKLDIKGNEVDHVNNAIVLWVDNHIDIMIDLSNKPKEQNKILIPLSALGSSGLNQLVNYFNVNLELAKRINGSIKSKLEREEIVMGLFVTFFYFLYLIFPY